MRKVSLVLYLVFWVFCVCKCNCASGLQDCRGYNFEETCKNFERNVICPINYQNITEVRRSDKVQINNKRESTFNIFEVWKSFPLKIFTNSSNISFRCQQEYNDYLMAVQNNELYALKMFDASAKLPSGILQGNVNQYGDFDECLEVPHAQYCLAEIDIAPLWKKSLAHYRDMAHSHFSIKESFNDPGHRVPGFSFIRWGFCLPRSCTSTDLTNALRHKLKVKARIRPGLCQSFAKQEEKLTFGHYFTIIYFGLLSLVIGTSTFLYTKTSFSKIDNKWDKMFMAFSLQYNYNQLVKLSENTNEFKSVHGVRCLSAIALLMAHKTMAALYNPYINRTLMTEMQSMKWSVLGRNAIIYTDCFLLISGLLNANALFEDLDKKGHKIKFKERLLNRLFRILPSLITVILFCTYVLPLMGSGPLWPLVINHHSYLCKKYMWRNMFMIHNYFGFENMCLTHTHQLSIDMQLFLVTPIFVYLVYKLKNKGLWIIVLIALFSTGLRFWKTLEHNLSHVVHFGIPISRMFDTANHSYILATHRATIYLIGVFLAYLLRYTNKTQSVLKNRLAYIWIIVYTIGLTTWFGPVTMCVRGFKYNRTQAALYGALSPITWGTAVAWVIYATERGFGSWFTPVLTWKYFQIFTKIAYGVYLVQFPVFFYNVGITRHVGEFKNYMMLPPVETGVIILIAILLSLCVEMPFQNVYKIFLTSK